MKQSEYTIATITEELHRKLKYVEKEFEQKLGKRVAIVAYEKRE